MNLIKGVIITFDHTYRGWTDNVFGFYTNFEQLYSSYYATNTHKIDNTSRN